MGNAKGVNTPMTSGLKLSAFSSDLVKVVNFYRSIIGALQYITIIGPEITYSVNKVCQIMQNPSLTHWQAVKRILRYLAGSLESGLVMKPSLNKSMVLERFYDADWTSEPDN